MPVGVLDVSPNGSRERPPAELNKVVVLLWFCLTKSGPMSNLPDEVERCLEP